MAGWPVTDNMSIMYASLTTFLLNIAKDNSILYAAAVIIVMALVALAMHGVLEKLLKVLKL